MAKSRPTAFERFRVWLCASPGGQFVVFLVCAGLLALCVWADGLAREFGRCSVLAPTRDGLWIGIAFGAAFGFMPVVAALVRRVLSLLLSPSEGAKECEQAGWRLWARCVYVLVYLGAFIVLLFAFLNWCFTSDLSLGPPYFASYLVGYVGLQLLRAVFGPEPESEIAEPVRPAG